MAGLIPQAFIDDVLDRCDIVDIIDSRVKLKKTGKNYSACCPFHDEKTPSFTVSPDKQFFYCFGCGASGNAIGFVMDYERLSFPEAIEGVAKHLGLEVPREERDPASEQRERERRAIYELLEQSDQFYQQQLRHHPYREEAINYLKSRGLDGLTCKTFGVGFAPDGWDNLLKELGDSDESKRLLNEAGLIVEHPQENKRYDRFRHRIMFPIRDARGRTIGFGGRVLGDGKPKYLNSPETPVFHKRHELYGLYEARQHNNHIDRLLVVEGYMDVVSLAQFNIRYAVATLGTACGEEHLNRAFKHTSEIVFCFDGDNAGRNAAKRALENALPTMTDGRQVKFLFLPEGEDPDTLVRQIGPEKFTHKVDMAVPLEDFFFDSLAEGSDVKTMEGRARLSKMAAPLLNQLPKGVYRELMFEYLAKRTGLSKDTLLDLTDLPAPSLAPAVEEPSNNPDSPDSSSTAPSRQYVSSGQPVNTNANVQYTVNDAAPPTSNSDVSDHHHHHDGYASDNNIPNDALSSYDQHLDQGQLASQPTTPTPSRYRLDTAQRLLALLLNHPEHAEHIQGIRDLNDPRESIQLIKQLLELLQERPHYRLQHIIGLWRSLHGEKSMQQLVNIAGLDLVQAAKHIHIGKPLDTQEGTPNYDALTTMRDCCRHLLQQQQQQKSGESLAKLKSSQFAELSKEEREQLVNAVLSGKKGPNTSH